MRRKKPYVFPSVLTSPIVSGACILADSVLGPVPFTVITSVGQPVDRLDLESGAGGIKNEDLEWETTFE